MKRIARTSRRRLSVEPLESRSLLSASSADEIFVRFSASDPTAKQAAELASVGGSIVTSYPDGPELVRLRSGVNPSVAVGRLEADAGVTYATLDATIHIASTPFIPNDMDFSQDWGLNQANNIDIDAPEAYGVSPGSPSVIVAVVDTGIDLGDPDLVGRLWTNPVNDAVGGFPNDIHGWNFVSNDNDVQDDNGHGTHVSAIIAAQANNSYGIAGVAPGVQLMPLKFLDQNGNGTTANAVSAIYYAVQHGAKVINASWGGQQFYGPLADAISYANAHNVVFVTASGNDGTDNDIVPSYPASYQMPNELSVASVDQNGNLASFSNYGVSTVNLAAPGVNIVSEVPTSIDPSGLETLSGTSMSTAYVSGVAALVASVNPFFTAAQIVQRLDSTVKILPSLEGKTISGGIVDAFSALTSTTPTIWSPPVPVAGIPALVPDESTVTQVHAAVLASDEFFATHGSTAVGFVAGLYESAFDRLPSLPELANYLSVYNSDQFTRYQMAVALLGFPEAKTTEVAQWYQTDLNRTTPIAFLKLDPGVEQWANLLVEGFGDNTVQALIMSSPEYLQGHGSSPVPIVEGYFGDLTGHAADPVQLAAWSNLLSQGVSPFDTVDFFLSSSEVSDTLVATWFLFDLGRNETLAQLVADPGLDSLAANIGNF
jgi:thermitase